jgi:hypothetical protein
MSALSCSDGGPGAGSADAGDGPDTVTGADAATDDAADGALFVCPVPWYFKVPAEETAAAVACPPAWPTISNAGFVASGPLTIVTITTVGDPVGDDLAAFGSDLVASDWWKTLASLYDLDPAPSAVHWIGPTIPPSGDGKWFAPEDVEAYIRTVINDPVAAAPAIPTGTLPIYILYTPPGVVLVRSDIPNTNCALGGYHSFSSQESPAFVFGVVQSCDGLLSTGPSMPPMQRLTVAGSHEIVEMATDPYLQGLRVASDPPGPWLGDEGEVADLCAGAWYPEGRWTYQRVWSNDAATAGRDPCVPGLIAPPGVFVGPTWNALPPSHMIRIPLTACNLDPGGVWQLRERIAPGDPGLCAAAQFEKGRQTGYPGIIALTEDSVSLLVALDPGAPSGSSAVVTVAAAPTTLAGTDLPTPYGVDLYKIGVFVP